MSSRRGRRRCWFALRWNGRCAHPSRGCSSRRTAGTHPRGHRLPHVSLEHSLRTCRCRLRRTGRLLGLRYRMHARSVRQADFWGNNKVKERYFHYLYNLYRIVAAAAPRAVIRRLFARLRVCARMKPTRFESPIGNAQELNGLLFEPQLVCCLIFASGPPPCPPPVRPLLPRTASDRPGPCKDAHRSGIPSRIRLGTAWMCFVQRCWLSGSLAHAHGAEVPPPDCRAVTVVWPQRR